MNDCMQRIDSSYWVYSHVLSIVCLARVLNIVRCVVRQ